MNAIKQDIRDAIRKSKSYDMTIEAVLCMLLADYVILDKSMLRDVLRENVKIKPRMRAQTVGSDCLAPLVFAEDGDNQRLFDASTAFEFNAAEIWKERDIANNLTQIVDSFVESAIVKLENIGDYENNSLEER